MAAALTGEPLKRADSRQIRDENGFAIGGVTDWPSDRDPGLADETLLGFDPVRAAAGAHDAVFAATATCRAKAAQAVVAKLAA